jgi:hypothetical protein
MSGPNSMSPMLSVLDKSQRCRGFIFRRGMTGFEAFDETRSLGFYASEPEAIAAIADSQIVLEAQTDEIAK